MTPSTTIDATASTTAARNPGKNIFHRDTGSANDTVEAS